MAEIIDLVTKLVTDSRDSFSGTMEGVTFEQMHHDPGGKALPIAALYAHLIFSEDLTIHTILQESPSLFEGSFQFKTGVNQNMPSFLDPDWSIKHEAWAKAVQLDLASFIEYEKAVHQATDEYIKSLTPEDLYKEIDIPGMGKQTIISVLTGFIIGHNFSLAGEVSALKGVLGLKGYKF